MFQGKPRDPWLGWSKPLQFHRLHLLGNHTRATIKGHAGWADDLIAQDGNGAGPEARRTAERWTSGHGRWERRALVPTAAVRDAWLPWPGVRQGFRVTPRTQQTQQDKVTPAGLSGFPSLRPEQAAPRRRLPWHRGHWTVENRNPLSRDVSLGEDASPSRTSRLAGRPTGSATVVARTEPASLQQENPP